MMLRVDMVVCVGLLRGTLKTIAPMPIVFQPGILPWPKPKRNCRKTACRWLARHHLAQSVVRWQHRVGRARQRANIKTWANVTREHLSHSFHNVTFQCHIQVCRCGLMPMQGTPTVWNTCAGHKTLHQQRILNVLVPVGRRKHRWIRHTVVRNNILIVLARLLSYIRRGQSKSP